jgi:hypothetical protein
MGNTNVDGIWTPDEDDTMEADVWSPMMAESISQGLGKRMALQETRVSLRATTPVPFKVTGTVKEDAYMQIPLTIAANTGIRFPNPDFSGGNHANGIEIEGNYAKIVTPGLYNITGQCTLFPGDTPHSWDFIGRINGEPFGLPDYGVTSAESWIGGQVQDTRFLAKDDMLELWCGVGTDHAGEFWVQDALLTISMLYAVPEA